MDISHAVSSIKQTLAAMSDEKVIGAVQKFIPTSQQVYGVRLPLLTQIAKQYREGGFELAVGFWDIRLWGGSYLACTTATMLLPAMALPGRTIMQTKPIERLLFAQGGRCFFCNDVLSLAEASVEHLNAIANGGRNLDENCVACCKSLNALLGRMSLKEKLRVVLNQKGDFKCPNGRGSHKSSSHHRPKVAGSKAIDKRVDLVLRDLHKRGAARPRTVKTLSSTINALFHKQLSEAEIKLLLDGLKSAGAISINGTKVSYAHGT